MKRYRVDKVASTIRDIVSDAIANRLSDPRINTLTSITRVEVTADLQFADVHVSVLGDEGAARTTMRGLAQAAPRVQRMVAKGLSVRRCPEVRFRLDDSLKKAAEMYRLIAENAPPEPEEGLDEPDRPDPGRLAPDAQEGSA